MSVEEAKVSKMGYKILIEFVFKSKSKIIGKHKYIVQNKPIIAGLRITNIDTKATPPGTIKGLYIKSGEGATITQNFVEELSFRALNPNETQALWWPDFFIPINKGQCWVECRVFPNDIKSDEFYTYQKDYPSNEEFKNENENLWGNALLIRGELEQQQARTNLLIIILTLLVLLEGVWGLDIVLKSVLIAVGWFFKLIGTFFTALV